jgi:hypothetical protein
MFRSRVGRAAVAATFALSALVALSACSNQGEGGRCSTNAENSGAEDCASGLVCVPNRELPNVTGGAEGDGRCCPPNRNTATELACKLGVIGAGDSGVPEGGPFDGGIPPEPPATDAGDAGDAASDGSDA